MQTCLSLWLNYVYSKTCLKRPLAKRTKIGFQDQLSLNVGQKYCRMLQGEHSAILLTFIKLPFVIKIFVFVFLSGRFTQVLLYIDSYTRNLVILDDEEFITDRRRLDPGGECVTVYSHICQVPATIYRLPRYIKPKSCVSFWSVVRWGGGDFLHILINP